jgi:hypothetical protein
MLKSRREKAGLEPSGKQANAMRCIRLLLAILSTATVGCRAWERSHVWLIDRHRAEQSLRADVSGGLARTPDFRSGYLAGYLNVASGGDGRPPLLPPRKYTKARYRGPHGQLAASAWFQGFQSGALSAQQEGVDQYNFLPISPVLLATCSSCQDPLAASAWPSGMLEPLPASGDPPEALPGPGASTAPLLDQPEPTRPKTDPRHAGTSPHANSSLAHARRAPHRVRPVAHDGPVIQSDARGKGQPAESQPIDRGIAALRAALGPQR